MTKLKVAYQGDIQQYQVPNRVHVDHILLMTVGKTPAEVEEIKAKAEDVLKQAKKGGKFDDLAKKYSEDPGTKDKGGDLGWITQGQTVPEFEKVAFSLPKGEISDLVKTQYGFHIIKVLDKETAHTKTFDEVKDQIRSPMVLQKADQYRQRHRGQAFGADSPVQQDFAGRSGEAISPGRRRDAAGCCDRSDHRAWAIRKK